jgi:hypothetical protein
VAHTLGVRKTQLFGSRRARLHHSAAAEGETEESVLQEVLRRLDEAGLRAVFEDEAWRIAEEDCRSLKRLCQLTDSEQDICELRRHVEAYILDCFDNMARVCLERVTHLSDIPKYAATLRSWCEEMLPGLERHFRPNVDEAVFRDIEETFGSIDGRVIGSVRRDRLAERVAHWKAEAISRARHMQAGQHSHSSSRKAEANSGSAAEAQQAMLDGRRHSANQRQVVDAYIEEVLQMTGKHITRTDIWKSARYKTRTEFERWERDSPRATKTAHERFSRILREKPHLK